MALLTLDQVAKLTGKHRDTIRDKVRKLKTDAGDNIQIIKGKYHIDKDYALSHIETPMKSLGKPLGTPTPAPDQTKIIDILHEQLKQKDEQIKQLLERNREQNINMNQMQSQLKLSAPQRKIKILSLFSRGKK